MSDYPLTHGSHATREEGTCLMEAVAYLAGEPHTDAPECACPVLTAYAVRINDAMGEGPDGDALRARYLHDLAPMLVGSRSTPEVEQARAFVLIDHAVRVFAPLALESAGLHDEARRLRALGAVVGEQSARAAEEAANAAEDAAWAARAAWTAKNAAWAARAATNAAANAAEDAAWAAGAAARAADAAARAADAVAEKAAWDAARAALVAALEAAP